MGQTPSPRVLLADDYAGMLTSLRRMLEPTCDVVGSVADGIALIEAAERLRPDVIVLDLNLPGMSGLDACRHIKQTTPQSQVVLLTAIGDAAIREMAFELGASAFVLKLVVADHLLPAIHKAHAGERYPAGW